MPTMMRGQHPQLFGKFPNSGGLWRLILLPQFQTDETHKMNVTTTADYDGLLEDEVDTGEADINVQFFVGYPDPDNVGKYIPADPGVSVLTLYVRKAGTDLEFIPVRSDAKSAAYRFAATGWDFYFKWSIKVPSEGLTCLLDAD